MFLPVFLGCISGYLCASMLLIGYSHIKSKLANRRVDKHVKELVAALNTAPAETVVRVPLVSRGTGEN